MAEGLTVQLTILSEACQAEARPRDQKPDEMFLTLCAGADWAFLFPQFSFILSPEVRGTSV